MPHIHDAEDLHVKYKTLSLKRESLNQDKARVEATLAARRKDLKALLDKARKDGFDPDNLETEIKHLEEVLRLKVDNFRADLEGAEKMLEPMKREIDG